MIILRGTTDVCLQHFIGSDKKNPAVKKRQAVMKFFNMPYEPTIRRWLKGIVQPIGENLIRMRFFLESIGYAVTELQELDPAVYEVARQFAYGEKTIGEINVLFGFLTANGSSQSLMIMHGIRKLPEEKIKKIIAAVPTIRTSFKQQAERTATSHYSAGEIQQTAKPACKTAVGAKVLLIESTALQVNNLTGLADYLLSDECSEEDRKKLHELAGADSVLKLVARLRRLCSETARKQL